MKPRVAFFDFACCEGCQLQVLNLEEQIPALIGQVDIVTWREAMTEKSDEYDIAFVEGSIANPEAVERIKKIRERAKVVVALGACAATAGLNALKNRLPTEAAMQYVYGDRANWFESIPAAPIDAYIKVDYYIHGCPVPFEALGETLQALIMGKKPDSYNRPLCVECKLRENACLYQLGKHCMGPITKSGCNAICPTYGSGCEGCRGLVENPNVNACVEVMQEYGLTPERIMDEHQLFNSYGKEQRG